MSSGKITKVRKSDDDKRITRVRPKDEDEIITKIPQSEKKPDLNNIILSDRKSSPEEEIKLDIKRGYEILPDNNVRFGIRITNYSNYAISDLEVILDYTESLFKLEGDKVQKLGTIPPNIPRTVTFLLKPLGCVHNENIGAIIHYRDHTWDKQVVTMRPKGVHCVCPFLKEKVMTRGEFLELSKSGHSAETGLNFQGIGADQLTSFLEQTCKNRQYKVDEYSIDGGKMLLLASESIGEKAIYLLTAYIRENEGLTQVMLRAVSDKSYGLNGFLNEIVDGLRHIVSTVQSALEIGVIKKEQVINIIDSVVQRTTFAVGEGAAEVNVEGSVVQRTEIKADDEKQRLEQERHIWEEREWKKKEEEREEQERIAKHDSKSRTNVFMLTIVLGALLVGFVMFAQGNYFPEKSTPYPFPSPNSNQNTFTNSIGMDFVLIPTGEFEMGSPSDEKSRANDEGPVHEVQISDSFYLGKYEVTQKQWRKIMKNNPSNFKGDDLPVETVYWNDVQEFVRKLNEWEGTDKYRLPSEAEWEYAARAGTTTRYSFGDDDAKLGDFAWYRDNSGSKTHPVGQKQPNSWGLYDMHGNVYEWVQDEWHSNYNGAPTDGSAWEDGSVSLRVNRGGSWYRYAWYSRSADRRNYDQNNRRYDSLGFRLVMEV